MNLLIMGLPGAGKGLRQLRLLKNLALLIFQREICFVQLWLTKQKWEPWQRVLLIRRACS